MRSSLSRDIKLRLLDIVHGQCAVSVAPGIPIKAVVGSTLLQTELHFSAYELPLNEALTQELAAIALKLIARSKRDLLC